MFTRRLLSEKSIKPFVVGGLLSLVGGCLKEPLETRRHAPGAGAPEIRTKPGTAEGEGERDPVLLRGTFAKVAKPVSGEVRLEQHGDTFELVVRHVTLTDPGPVHVYFVGLDEVTSTLALDNVEAKYDFGPLEETGSGTFVDEQRIRLPSRPAPELKSVALVNPRFGVVLASSSLKSPK